MFDFCFLFVLVPNPVICEPCTKYTHTWFSMIHLSNLLLCRMPPGDVSPKPLFPHRNDQFSQMIWINLLLCRMSPCDISSYPCFPIHFGSAGCPPVTSVFFSLLDQESLWVILCCLNPDLMLYTWFSNNSRFFLVMGNLAHFLFSFSLGWAHRTQHFLVSLHDSSFSFVKKYCLGLCGLSKRQLVTYRSLATFWPLPHFSTTPNANHLSCLLQKISQ